MEMATQRKGEKSKVILYHHNPEQLHQVKDKKEKEESQERQQIAAAASAREPINHIIGECN